MKATASVLLLAISAVPALGQDAPPSYDFNFVTVGDPGNPPFNGQVPFGWTGPLGRGEVDYEFRASTLEITTAQWVEFLNAFGPVTGSPINNSGPVHWGAGAVGQFPNGRWRYAVNTGIPNAGMLPVGGISWRDAARYCNWLQHGKAATLEAISTGAYDTSTWGDEADGVVTDAPNRMPGALYFLPTYDEEIKAAHWDQNRYGLGQGGWWRYKNKTDAPGTPGAPGVGTTSAGYWTDESINAGWFVPLGGYTTQVSPWGLLDTSGGAQEWNEELFSSRERGFMGTCAAGNASTLQNFDAIWGMSTSSPANGLGRGTVGFRVYSATHIPPVGCGTSDFNHDGDIGTDSDIEAFFACLGGSCCSLCDSADFNGDGDVGTDGDIESFFRVLAGGNC